jgi:hypothetical protein
MTDVADTTAFRRSHNIGEGVHLPGCNVLLEVELGA